MLGILSISLLLDGHRGRGLAAGADLLRGDLLLVGKVLLIILVLVLGGVVHAFDGDVRRRAATIFLSFPVAAVLDLLLRQLF